jgi:hypothetical protein
MMSFNNNNNLYNNFVEKFGISHAGAFLGLLKEVNQDKKIEKAKLIEEAKSSKLAETKTVSYGNKKRGSKSKKFGNLKGGSEKGDSDKIPLKELQQFQDSVCLDLGGRGVIFFL